MSIRRRVGRKARRSGHGIEFAVRLNGRRLSKTFHDRKAGELWVHEMKAQASRGEVGLPQDVTFAEAFERYYKDKGPGLSPASKALYASFWTNHLSPAFGPRLLSSIRAGDLQSWLGQLREHLAHGSLQRLVGLFKAIWNHAITAGLVTTNPLRDVRLGRGVKVRETRMYTDDELDLIKQSCTTPRHLALVQVALGTALRRGELMAMEWSWLDWPREMIRVPASLEGGFVPKGRQAREFWLGPDVMAALKAWRQHATGEGRIFTGVNIQRWALDIRAESARIRAKALEINLDKLSLADRRAKIKELGVPFRWHLLRHTATSRLVMAGVNLKTVMAITGHTSLRMLERYSHLSPDAFDDVRRRLPGGIAAERPRVISLESRRRAKRRRSS